MASKTFAQIRTALASMWGYESYDDLLAQDQADIDAYINAAHFDCFVPADGTRANWPEQYFSGILKAPVATTLTLTNGSTAITGYSFEAAYFGSYVKVGDKFIRYGAAAALVSPWDGDTGSYSATVYHNAYVLPASVVELASVPNLIGIGLLGALPDPDKELSLRAEPAFDFDSRNQTRPLAIHRNTFRNSSYFDVGDPRYYFIDQASVGASFSIGNRFHVYPFPDRVCTFECRANVIPSALTTGTDVPAMPANTVDNILLPIAREKLAKNSANRRYTGPNVQLLSDEAERARAQLKSLRRTQRDVAGSVRVRRGW